jgi:hypothetical protein
MIVIVPAVTHQELVLRVLDTRVMARPPSSKDHFKSSFNFKSCVIDGQAYPQLMSFHNDRYNFGSRLCRQFRFTQTRDARARSGKRGH